MFTALVHPVLAIHAMNQGLIVFFLFATFAPNRSAFTKWAIEWLGSSITRDTNTDRVQPEFASITLH
jgi:hypothetical protein